MKRYCSAGWKLYLEWARLKEELAVLLDSTADDDLTRQNLELIRDTRAKVKAAWRAWREHQRDCAECVA